MKHINLFEDFENESEDNSIDLALEFENKMRTLDDVKDADYSVDDFLDEFNVESKYRTDFAFAAILKQTQKYKGMSDEEFFELYNKSKK